MKLSTKDICFGYEHTVDAVNGVSIELVGGSLTGIVGPNGSGKTTLLKLMAGAIKPRAGEVLLDGAPIRTLNSRTLARHIAVVPQSSHLTFPFTALDIVLMGRHAHIGRFRSEGTDDVQKARSAMAAVGVLHLAARQGSTLSGGEWQRVMIARALCQQTPVLLLDEPVASLDIKHQIEVLSLIESLSHTQGILSACVLHDLNLAAQYCDRIILMHEGRVLAIGPVREVFTRENIQRAYDVRAQVEEEGEFGVRIVPEYHPPEDFALKR